MSIVSPEELQQIEVLQKGLESAKVRRGGIGGWIDRARTFREAEHFFTETGPSLLKAVAARIQAREQQAAVSDIRTAQDAALLSYQGVSEPQRITFPWLRSAAKACEPLHAIIITRCNQVADFARYQRARNGVDTEAGYRIVMTDEQEPATDADRKNLNGLQRFFEETGFCDPPIDECPIGWEKGFGPFLQAITRDFMTMDHVAIRRWSSSEAPDRFPLVCFAAEDAGLIRKVRRRRVGVREGAILTEQFPSERVNTNREIRTVKMSQPVGGAISEQYTRWEMAVSKRRVMTDEQYNGYGRSEVEDCAVPAMAWTLARAYNESRFRNDALPRGAMVMFGAFDEASFASFKLAWEQQLKGNTNRWKVPWLRGNPQQGSSVQFIPFDMSSREMEYHQFMYSLAIWIHGLCSIHPEETGWEASSPYRAPLSERSPEATLKSSQDTGLRPLIHHIEGLINRELTWKLFPDRRYSLRFVGLGDRDTMAYVQRWSGQLEAGGATPREWWDDMDKELPEPVKDHPAWDLPMPFAQGVDLLNSMAQQARQQQQEDQAMQQQQARESAMRAMPPEQPGGMQGGVPGANEGQVSDDQGAPVTMPFQKSLAASSGHGKRRMVRIYRNTDEYFV